MLRSIPLLFLCASLVSVCCAVADTSTPPALAETPIAPGIAKVDPLTLDAEFDFWHDIPAKTSDGLVNVVVEIPSGTNEKWEVKSDGNMVWDKKNGIPRVVPYIGYVGNYGSVPRTEQADGDPIDLIALSPAFPRGSVVPVRVIGVIVVNDDGAQDDKLFGVVPGMPMGDVKTLEEMNEKFRGVLEILKIFFSYYKGPDGGGMALEGVGDEVMAMKLVDESIARYSTKRSVPAN